MIAPDTGTPIQTIRTATWKAAGQVVAFEATTGPGQYALYAWENGVLSLLARPGTALPGTSTAISWLEDFEASEDLVFFSARYDDGSRRLHAWAAGE